MRKKKEGPDKQTAKRDSKMTLATAKTTPKKSMDGKDMPNKMYLPKNTPAKTKAAPKSKPVKYRAPKKKAIYGTVKNQQRKQRGLKKCR